jgi:hypothetical protein
VGTGGGARGDDCKEGVAERQPISGQEGRADLVSEGSSAPNHLHSVDGLCFLHFKPPRNASVPSGHTTRMSREPEGLTHGSSFMIVRYIPLLCGLSPNANPMLSHDPDLTSHLSLYEESAKTGDEPLKRGNRLVRKTQNHDAGVASRRVTTSIAETTVESHQSAALVQTYPGDLIIRCAPEFFLENGGDIVLIPRQQGAQ